MNKEQGLECFEEIIKQITKLQIMMGEYMLEHKNFKKDFIDYNFPRAFYRVRNSYEGLRIRKLELNMRKNKLLASKGIN